MGRIEEIVESLKLASDKYYNEGDTPLSDQEFDDLKVELKKLAPNHPFFAQVGAAPSNHLKQVNLIAFMGSCNHATCDEEFFKWYDKYKNQEVIFSDKVDGASCEILYEDGKLVRVASRGDGHVGLDWTSNAKYWANLPHTIKLKGRVIVRGEAVLYKKLWEKYFGGKSNPRNAGTGLCARKSDPEDNRHMHVIAFDITVDEKILLQEDKFKLLKTLGFDVVRWFKANHVDVVQQVWAQYKIDRDSLEYEIDGSVVYLQDVELQDKLGYSNDNRSKGNIAWKFEAQQKVTTVTGITITIGKSGNLIPTFKLEPIYIGGVTVSNCLMTTFSRIESLNANIGDAVMLIRRGDVIPYIDKVVKKNTAGPYPRPTKCPHCGSKLEARGAYLVCPEHESCPGQQFRRIEGWIKKNDIKQFGTSLLEALYDNGMVKKIADIYKLDWDKVAAVQVGNGVLGESLAGRIRIEVEKTLGITIDQFIGSFGVKDLGRSTAKTIGFKVVGDYLNLTVENAVGLPGIGQLKAESIVASLKMFKDEIEELAQIIKPIGEKAVNNNGALANLTYCFTGVRMTSSEKELFEGLGGIEKSSVVKGLDYLVCKDTAASSGKLDKARAAGVKLLSIDDFRKMLVKK